MKAEPSLPLVRWGLLAGLLLLEYLVVSLLFDAQPLQEAGGLLSGLGYLGDAIPLAVAVGAAALLLAGRELRTALVAELAETDTPRRIWPLMGAHLITYGLFLALTKLVFSGANTPGSGLVLGWLAAGTTSAALLLPAALPLSSIRTLMPRIAGALGLAVLVGSAAWGAGMAAENLWHHLSEPTLYSVAYLLHIVEPHVLIDPEAMNIGTEAFLVNIAPECSGFEGIGLIVVLLSAYLWWSRAELRFPNALLLLPVAVAVVWVANSIRIAALILVGTHVSADVALGGFHSRAGWLLFCAIALGLVAISRRAAIFARRVEPRSDTTNPTAAYLLPLLAVIATGLFTGLFAAGLDTLYGIRIVAGGATLWVFRKQLTGLGLTWSAPPFLIGALVFGLWIAVEPAGDPQALLATQNELDELGPALRPAWLALRIVGSVLLIPVVEELAFRGFLIRRLIRRDFLAVRPDQLTWVSFLLSSLAFGVLHQRWIAGTVAGMLFALAQYRRGRLGDAIIAHAVANGLLALFVVLTERWSLFS